MKDPHDHQEALRDEVERLREQVRVVSDLATSLMSELDLEVVLPSVLSSARRFTRAEAGSLYVVSDGHLVFAEAQNDRLGTETETAPDLRLPIDESSLAGLAAARREVLNIPDVRQHPSFNRASRDAFGYEVVSMLVVPLTDHRGDVQGVLQLLNALDEGGAPAPFTEEAAWLSRIFGAHAATAMEIARLHGELKAVFDSFVGYTAQAIDARDAATAGHSSRVAAQACRVAEELGGFTPADLRELRFAGMFHDVGKIGVRERVLTKSDKLEPEALATVEERFRAAAEALLARARLEAGSDDAHPAVVAAREGAGQLVADLGFLAAASRPGWLTDDDLARLAEVGRRTWRDWRGEERPLLTADELEKLSVRKGNLTASERLDIQLHVDHSYSFLKKIPFPRELARVPEIVWSHHEKMDGSGYPRGLAGEEIPMQSRILAAVDVFDALTATDRPYKKAMSPWKALEILDHEAEQGAWDPQVLAAMRRALEAGRLVSRRVMERHADDEPLDLARESWKKA